MHPAELRRLNIAMGRPVKPRRLHAHQRRALKGIVNPRATKPLGPCVKCGHLVNLVWSVKDDKMMKRHVRPDPSFWYDHEPWVVVLPDA